MKRQKVMTPLTRAMIERAVEGLFVMGGIPPLGGRVATRLVLVVDTGHDYDGAEKLGGLCREAVVERLCESFGVGP